MKNSFFCVVSKNCHLKAFTSNFTDRLSFGESVNRSYQLCHFHRLGLLVFKNVFKISSAE